MINHRSHSCEWMSQTRHTSLEVFIRTLTELHLWCVRLWWPVSAPSLNHFLNVKHNMVHLTSLSFQCSSKLKLWLTPSRVTQHQLCLFIDNMSETSEDPRDLINDHSDGCDMRVISVYYFTSLTWRAPYFTSHFASEIWCISIWNKKSKWHKAEN